MSVIYEGTTIQVEATFRDLAGDLADTTAKLIVEEPDGTVTEYTSPVHVGLGVYAQSFPAEPGLYRWRWEGAGALVAASEGFFFARETAIG